MFHIIADLPVRVKPPSDKPINPAGSISKETIDHLTKQMRSIENDVEGKIKLSSPYVRLQVFPGLGNTLGLTITLETGPVSRVPKVGNHVSYCRKVGSAWVSNGKKKGRGNQKNGNRYLAWVYSEAPELGPTLR